MHIISNTSDISPVLSFRKAIPDDATILANLRIHFAQEISGNQAEEKVEMLRTQLKSYFEQATLENTCISILAECDKQVVGIGSVHLREMPGNFRNPSGKWGYIMNMYTLPDYRKRGICKTILQLLQEESIKLGVTAFELHATEIGQTQYLKDGFHLHNQPTLRKFVME